MDPGELKDRVTIQTKTSSPTGDVWSDLRSQWAKILPLRSSKIAFLSAQGSRVTHTVIFREKPEVTIEQRITFEGRTYKIVAVQIFDESQEALTEVIQ